MTGLVLPDAGTDPAGFVLAVADLREKRIKVATPGPYEALSLHTINGVDWQIHAGPAGAVWLYVGAEDQDRADAEHIAAEANPAHALAEVALWRAVVAEHQRMAGNAATALGDDVGCWSDGSPEWAAVVAAARAYLGEQT